MDTKSLHLIVSNSERRTTVTNGSFWTMVLVGHFIAGYADITDLYSIIRRRDRGSTDTTTNALAPSNRLKMPSLRVGRVGPLRVYGNRNGLNGNGDEPSSAPSRSFHFTYLFRFRGGVRS
jgi:hypothetical protein